jgi:hypothetical protein
MTFTAGFLLLFWVTGSILVNGIVLLHRFTRLRGLELIGYGAAAGVFLHGLIGLGIAVFPGARSVFVALLMAMTLLCVILLFTRRILQEVFRDLSGPSKTALALWALFLVLALGILHLQVRLPDPLPDGQYIFKTPTTNVKIQYLTALPADNYIPFAVAEFFLRGVSFKNVRPILPRAEVSNRTILMSLVVMPFRVALGAPRDYPSLGVFSYVGGTWPDVAKLNEGPFFDQFVVVGLVLNSLLLLGLFVFCSSFGANSVLPLAATLYVTNPYFVAQTIYTWPKALAGFFILLAWTSIRSGHGPMVVGALFALAFHSHPYAIVFAAWAGLFYLTQWRREKSGVPAAIGYALVFALILAPWIIWTRWTLGIPSDLVAQNFASPEMAPAWASPLDFVWIRLHNLFYLLCSTIFLVYPFDFRAILNAWIFSLPGVVGIVLIYPALAQCRELTKPQPWLWYGILGPALSILAVYSSPALPVLHGYQAVVGVFLFFAVWWLSRRCSRKICFAVAGLQLALNLAIVVARAVITGVLF